MLFTRVLFIAMLLALLGVSAAAQRNNPYSTNPGSLTSVQRPDEQRPTIAQQTFRIAADLVKRSARPTEVYRLGVGDVLRISLTNAPGADGYYTIRPDGSIDFPLAGESPMVEGLTLDEAEDSLSSKVTLYRDARVTLKVRDYASHKITITGMAALKGERSLRREAMPLFAIRADAEVDPAATKVLIRRTDLTKPEVFSLSDEATGDVLIYPGDTIEFAAEAVPVGMPSFCYVSGTILSPGQKEMHAGMTLMQGIFAAGGLAKTAKRAVIRRKADNGTLSLTEYDVRRILDGKVPDPLLEAGDMIEVFN